MQNEKQDNSCSRMSAKPRNWKQQWPKKAEVYQEAENRGFSCMCVRNMVRPLLDPFPHPAQPGKYFLPTLAEDWKFVQFTEDPEPDTSGRVKDRKRCHTENRGTKWKATIRLFSLSSPQIPWFQSSQVYIFQAENWRLHLWRN